VDLKKGPESAGMPLVGSDPPQVGPYTMLSRLGQGGMGVVYLGRSPQGRLVAVKVIRPEVARDPEFRVRFRREVTNARRVRGFCTAEVLDADPDAEPAYLVTDFVPGPTLTAAVNDRGPLQAADLEQLAIVVATALTVIHGAGVIHRDLKPSNVLLSPTGARVIDFGIARALDATTALSRDLGRLGTPAFMAPEQVQGIVPTPAVDIYAWGGLVIYAATGRLPFGDAPAALLPYRILSEQPNLDGVPSRLREIVTAAMRKEPADRPTAAGLYGMLVNGPRPAAEPVLTKTGDVADATTLLPPRPADPVPATPADGPTAGPPAPGGRRRRGRALLAAAVAVVVGIAVATVVLVTRPAHHAPSAEELAAASRTLAAQAVTAGTTDNALSLRLAVAAYQLAPTSQARAALLPAAAANQLTASSTLSGHTRAVNAVAFTPDGHTLATVSDDDTARLWDVTNPRQPQLLSTLSGHTGFIYGMAISADGRMLATGSRDKTAKLWDISDHRQPRLLSTITGHTDTISGVGFSPDGRILATGSHDLTTKLWDITDPREPRLISTLTGATNYVRVALFSPDGRTLVTAGNDHTARLWDVTDPAAPQLLSVLTGHTDYINGAAFSPDGRTLATASGDGTARVWDITNPNQPTTIATLAGHTGPVVDVAFTADGHLLATVSGDHTARLWDITNLGQPRTLAVLTGHTDQVNGVVFSPDGKTLATASNDHTARLWDIDPADLVRRACANPTSQLTPAAWHVYLPRLRYRASCP
jgi:WD40 repeat protein